MYILVKASILRGFLNKDVVERLIRHEQVPYQASRPHPSSRIPVVYIRAYIYGALIA